MRIVALSAFGLLAGCGLDEARDCSGGRCEMEGSREELLAAIDGFNDPVARYLRAAATDRGTLEGDYRMVIDGVGDELGCDPSSEKSYVVLSNQGYLPKPIVTRCSSSAVDASQFYVAMVAKDDRSGLDPLQTHLAAWDQDAGVYRRYATSPSTDGGGEMAINVAPEFCLGCHAGPEKLGTWQPIMNEMSSPWSNWNAHPGFTSQLFDEHLDAKFAADATYRDVTRDGILDSAASFEPIVRAGITRVTNARLKARRQAASVDHALELVRPLYCDEWTNYVSEVHGSGELRMHALVDDAIRNLFREANADGPWTWLVDTRMQLPPPTTNEAPVTLIPVRGEATIQVELGLVARGVLAPKDVLRVRALDWKHPVKSAFRCDLYQQAATRIASGALDAAVAASGATTTEGLVPLVFDEVMKLDGQPFAPATGDVLAIAEAGGPTLELTLDQFGAALEAHVTSYQSSPMRSVLAAERDLRACAIALDPTAPIYDLSCP